MTGGRRGQPGLSVVIPAYNEEKRLGATIEAVARYLAETGAPFEIIVVNDGSTDRTGPLAEEAARRFPGVRVINGRTNRGKGFAVRRGVLAARGDKVLFTDSDLSTPVAELPKLLAAVDGGCHGAIGSRAAPGARIFVAQPLLRRLTGRLFPLLVRLLVTRRFRDTQCGFKLFRRAAARRLFLPLRTRGFAFDVEILARAIALGYRIAEVPVDWYNSPDSRVRIWRDPVRMLRDLLAIRRAVGGTTGRRGGRRP